MIEIKKNVKKRKYNVLLLNAVLIMAITNFSNAVYAMPSYGFGAINNEMNAVYIDMNMSNANNPDAWASSRAPFALRPAQDVIHIDIGAMETIQQDIPKNGERIGTLTIPSGKQIGVFGGESLKSMDKGAAHFRDTGLNFGNTALIGHNRGRSNGFFIFVKDLQVGQTLTLEANGITKAYVVAEMHKVHATDTNLLMHFGDSRLTLLTCWEDEKEYRRVVVAYEE